MSDDTTMEDVCAKLAKAKKKKENARQEQDGAKQCKMSNTSDRNMQDVYAKLAEARKKKADLDRLKHNASSSKCYNKRRSPRLPRHRRRLLRMGMAKHSTIVLLPRNKKYAGMLTVETNLQSYLYVRVMKKIPI